jgi:hypothetical protein
MKARYGSLILIVLALLLALSQPGQATVAAAAPNVARASMSALPAPRQNHTPADVTPAATHYVYLPLVQKDPLSCYTGQSYGGFNPSGMADPPAAQSADMNLSLRGYDNVDSRGYTLGLVSIGGSHDALAPRLNTLLNRTPTFTHNYQVYDWNWPPPGGTGPLPYGAKGKRLDPNNCPVSQCWEVSLLGFRTNIGELVYLPTSGYGDIAGGIYYALVLYATPSSITLKYTSEDSVVSGYTLQVDNVCVDPNLVAAYQTDNNSHGRKPLPALRAHQAFGVANGAEIGVAIRDNGRFMDPRSQQDWWSH